MIASDVFAVLGIAPALPGARCRGRHELFDEAGPGEASETVDERHAQALMLCRACPSRAACETWFSSLTAGKKPSGVIAGRINSPRRGRPRKVAS